MDLVTSFFHLLSDYCVCFDDGMITWDGHHHAATGLHVDNEKVPELTEFATQGGFDDLNDYLNCFVDGFLNNLVEADEDLIVPRIAIHEALYPMLREGDLTGLVLADFCGCNKALVIDNPAPDAYCVLYDTRIARGIPQFFNLVTRMLWDMRQGLRSQQDVSFKVTFVAAKNVDLSMLVVDDVTDVVGAQENPGTTMVYSAPKIRLDARNGSESVSASVTLENDGDASGNKNEGAGEKPQSFQPKSWAEDETRDRVYALADRCLADQDELDQAEAEKVEFQRKLESSADAVAWANSEFKRCRRLERERELLAGQRSALDDDVCNCEKELQSSGFFDIKNKRRLKQKLLNLVERIEQVESSAKEVELKLMKCSSEVAKTNIDELRQQEVDAQLTLEEAEASCRQKESALEESRAELEAFCASVPDDDRMDGYFWDADWRIREARVRRAVPGSRTECWRIAKQFVQTIDIYDSFTSADILSSFPELLTYRRAEAIIELYKLTNSIETIGPFGNLTAYIFTDTEFMDMWPD